MADQESQNRTLQQWIGQYSADALGKLTHELVANPVVNKALTRAFEAQEKASHAQERAFGALNIPTVTDLERVSKRLRTITERLDQLEDEVERVHRRLDSQAT